MKTGRSIEPVAITERVFQQQILSLLSTLGWRTAHFRPARTANGWRTAVAGDGVGFPDVVAIKAGRIIYAELKTDTGKVSPAQDAWLEALKETGAEVYLWRPRDWDEITQIVIGRKIQ